MSLQDKADYIDGKLSPVLGGGTPLTDIVTNQSDPLVNLVTTVLKGQERVEQKLAHIKSGLYPADLAGEDLTLVAQLMGTDRRIDQPSKAPVIVVGGAGRSLPVGSVLIDFKGNEWTTTQVAVIDNGYAWTNACSPVGRFDLDNGELRLRDSFPGIDSATNSATPVLGGEFETDEALRNRLIGRRPQWQTRGTASNLEFELENVAGVLDARVITDLPECFSENGCPQYMVGVLGGSSNDIAKTIFDNITIGTDRLIGNRSAPYLCDTIRFQRICPVMIEVRYWVRCDCPEPFGSSNFAADIADRLNDLSLDNQNLSSTDLCRISKDIVKLEFRAIPMDLGDVSPECLDERTTFDNPITGVEGEVYATDDPNSNCYAGADCAEFSECLALNPWSYGVFFANNVTRGTGCPCPTVDDGCGCSGSPEEPVVEPPTTFLMFDNFDGPENQLINGRAMDTGEVWAESPLPINKLMLNGTGGAGGTVGGDGVLQFATSEGLAFDGVINAQIQYPSLAGPLIGNIGIVARYLDDNNFVYISYEATYNAGADQTEFDIKLSKFVSGAEIVVGTNTQTVTGATSVLVNARVDLDGELITVYWQGTPVIFDNIPEHATQTRHGWNVELFDNVGEDYVFRDILYWEFTNL